MTKVYRLEAPQIVRATVERVFDAVEEDKARLIEGRIHSTLRWDTLREPKAEEDKLLEQKILPALYNTGFPVISEESFDPDVPINVEFTWLVDPLDGTYNFISGLGPSTISIALLHHGKLFFGGVLDLTRWDRYFGCRALASDMNSNPIKARPTSLVQDSVFCTGFPSRFIFSQTSLNRLSAIYRKVRKVRMLGCASYSILMVARGSADIYYEEDIMLWDVAAACCIAEGAGCSVRMTQLEDYRCNVLVTSTAALMRELNL